MKQKRILTKKQRIKRCNNCSKVKIIETSGTVKCRGITGGADLFIEPPITCSFYHPRDKEE